MSVSSRASPPPPEVLSLIPPASFDAFPYETPYSIQNDLMHTLYSAIESRSVAIVESPTGTGKTLSLLTSALTWLKDEQNRSKKGQLNSLRHALETSSASEPRWVIEQSIARHKRALDQEEEEFAGRLAKARKREEIVRRKENGRVIKKTKLTNDPEPQDDSRFLPDDDDDEDKDMLPENIDPLVREQLKKLRSKTYASKNNAEEDPICTKIFFASRTHTQLTQAISELRKITGGEVTRAISLASRKNLCIHDTLRAQAGDLDEACREINTRPKESRCPFLPGIDEESRLLDFRDHALAHPKDIEDLVSLGREQKTCPYYGTRKAINRAELVTLPYNLLLQKPAREALGIDLKNHIILLIPFSQFTPEPCRTPFYNYHYPN
ncbi:hypothetical protein BS47DRAFT_546430 [Hydnum rufescens UP504]|uniref:ATP-dependent DNA helicase CHL1 n=1 Tax=Hydnum rufescens UP504 TaxID=1448309 RepID=A0A9P6B3U6_9AGAM|nr:hypothetical protein BS47DRAFT_546430 [Hydnum rufescens UP504]